MYCINVSSCSSVGRIEMKITKVDELILEMLRQKEGEGDNCYGIAMELNRDPAHIYRRLERMVYHRALTKVKSRPVIYKINRKRESNLTLKEIQCPRCQTNAVVDNDQTTRKCKGCHKRFYIYNNRVLNVKTI